MAVDDENFLHDFSILSKYQTGRIELPFTFFNHRRYFSWPIMSNLCFFLSI